LAQVVVVLLVLLKATPQVGDMGEATQEKQ
jgi:hypothetical protein